jgi:hypothetical protein
MSSEMEKFSPVLVNAVTVLQLKSETVLKAARHRNPVTCIGCRIQSRSISFNPALKTSTDRNLIALYTTHGKL